MVCGPWVSEIPRGSGPLLTTCYLVNGVPVNSNLTPDTLESSPPGTRLTPYSSQYDRLSELFSSTPCPLSHTFPGPHSITPNDVDFVPQGEPLDTLYS